MCSPTKRGLVGCLLEEAILSSRLSHPGVLQQRCASASPLTAVEPVRSASVSTERVKKFGHHTNKHSQTVGLMSHVAIHDVN